MLEPIQHSVTVIVHHDVGCLTCCPDASPAHGEDKRGKPVAGPSSNPSQRIDKQVASLCKLRHEAVQDEVCTRAKRGGVSLFSGYHLLRSHSTLLVITFSSALFSYNYLFTVTWPTLITMSTQITCYKSSRKLVSSSLSKVKPTKRPLPCFEVYGTSTTTR